MSIQRRTLTVSDTPPTTAVVQDRVAADSRLIVETNRPWFHLRPVYCYVQIHDHDSLKDMTEKHSIADARRNLPKLIREAEHGKTVELTRRGKPVAVLIGRGAFDRLAAGRRGFRDAYADFVTAVDVSALALNPDEIFEGVRDSTPGREIQA